MAVRSSCASVGIEPLAGGGEHRTSGRCAEELGIAQVALGENAQPGDLVGELARRCLAKAGVSSLARTAFEIERLHAVVALGQTQK
jgi:hypothetical protein